ncbi:MAG: hypothetical protein HQ559_08800 [Lentisphaerae bacterium]|nr:hypothetical protein [Lentisphaerota bacterium]
MTVAPTSDTGNVSRPVLPRAIPLLLLAVLCVIAYSNSLRGAFVFDDISRIVQNPEIRSFRLAAASWRPVLMLSFAFNHAVGGMEPAGYRLVNIVIHLCGALCLYGIVRRSLLLPRFYSRFRDSAVAIAFAVAAVWVVHPLQTAAVTYVIQRAESLTGLFFLLALYCLVRGNSGESGRGWLAASVAACALGMGTKEVMVTAPVILAIYHIVYVRPSGQRFLRREWLLYLGLAATWIVLGVLMAGKLQSAPDRPFAQPGVKALTYALTEAQVLVHYLRLSFAPWPLRLDYAWPLVSSWREAMVPGVFILLLGLATTYALRRAPEWGFPALWFFVILAPTSSFLPRPDPAFEHRMYLALAGIVVLTILGVKAGLDRVFDRAKADDVVRRALCLLLLVGVLVPLTFLTRSRNAEYATQETFWRHEISRDPTNARAYNELAQAFIGAGNYEAALASAAGSLWVQAHGSPRESPPGRDAILALVVRGDSHAFALSHTYIGVALQCLKRGEQAVLHYRLALQADPSLREARQNLSLILGRRGEKQ